MNGFLRVGTPGLNSIGDYQEQAYLSGPRLLGTL